MQNQSNIYQRVADRYLIKKAAQQVARVVCQDRSFRTRTASLSGFTPEVVAAFVEGFQVRPPQSRVAFMGLVQKVKKLVSFFGKAPDLWEKFKKLLGITKITELPSKIKDWAKQGLAALHKAVDKVFSTWPLKIYTLEQGKLRGISDLLKDIMDRFPRFKQILDSKAKPVVDILDKLLRKYLPVVGTVILVAIFIWIWLNVVEFEWDLKALTDVMVGRLGLADLLISLPASGLGFLMNALHLGTFTLLPYLLVSRLLYLMAHRYISWKGGFVIHWDLLKKDMGVSKEELKTAPAVV